MFVVAETICRRVDDSNMGDWSSNDQTFIEIFFQSSCNCLIVSEKNFTWEMQIKWSNYHFYGILGRLTIV